MAIGEIVAKRDLFLVPGEPMTPSHIAVDYKIDSQGVYTIVFPAADYTSEKAVAAVREKVKAWAKVVGKPLEEK